MEEMTKLLRAGEAGCCEATNGRGIRIPPPAPFVPGESPSWERYAKKLLAEVHATMAREIDAEAAEIARRRTERRDGA